MFHPSPEPIGPGPRIVLDTQVVLDWMVFRDAGVSALVRAVEQGSLHWLSTQAMRNELEHVLDRGVGAAWGPDRTAIARQFERLAHLVHPLPAAGHGLRCTDPDDQMFIELALQVRARWLFTRDRALLRLARPARAYGVTILQPVDWMPAAPAADGTCEPRPST